MPIPPRRIPVQLIEATPTPVTVDAVKKQLSNIGLNCDLAAEENLEVYIKEVERRIPAGGTETYQILKPTTNPSARVAGLYGDYSSRPSGTGNRPVPASVTPGNWSSSRSQPISTGCSDNQPEFTGIVNNPAAVQGTLRQRRRDQGDVHQRLGENASASLIKGLNRGFDGVGIEQRDRSTHRQERPELRAGSEQSRVIFLVEDYDPVTGGAAAVGVLTLWWDLKIVDYKEKKKSPQHDTTLTVRGRGRCSTAPSRAMNSDYLAARAARSRRTRWGPWRSPRSRPRWMIFTARPAPTEDTFFEEPAQDRYSGEASGDRALRTEPAGLIGSIDNTNSDVTTTYEKSVTSGFTFSMSHAAERRGEL